MKLHFLESLQNLSKYSKVHILTVTSMKWWLFEKMLKLRVLPVTFLKNINVKILYCRCKNTDQDFVTSERLKSNKPPMLKLQTVKHIVLFHHFCISDIDKIRTKIAVVLKIHFQKAIANWNLGWKFEAFWFTYRKMVVF